MTSGESIDREMTRVFEAAEIVYELGKTLNNDDGLDLCIRIHRRLFRRHRELNYLLKLEKHWSMNENTTSDYQ
jgi:hypothetical protein